jgi:hypothetical protein
VAIYEKSVVQYADLSLLQIVSLLTVSISFSYDPSLDENVPEAQHGQYGYELGIYGE